MKTGRTFEEMAREISRRQTTKVDYVASTETLGFEAHGQDRAAWALEVPGQGFFEISDHTHRQIATHTGVPLRYYDRMRQEQPELLANNVRTWFDSDPKRRMVRTLDGTARAFLSDRYKRIDNYEVLAAAMPAMMDRPDAYILSCDVTDKALYTKVLFQDLVAEVTPGDQVYGGVMLRNSEIGSGKLAVTGFYYRSFCTNGLVFGSADTFSFSRTHLGGRVIEGTDYQILSDSTIEAQDRAMLGEVADTVRAAADPVAFEKAISTFRSATEGPQIVNPIAAVETLREHVTVTETEAQEILLNLAGDRDYSRWGMLNAVTKVANETESYDRATEIEELGAEILRMPIRTWTQIADAVPVAA